jgi:large subunit ribosomal protein L23
MSIFHKKVEKKEEKAIEKKGAFLKEKKEEKKASTKKVVEKKEIEKKEIEKKEKKTVILEDKKGLAYRILKKPHITEKASVLAEEGKYVFEVFENANKVDIAKAIKNVYNVTVEKVRIINIPKKRKRIRKGFALTGGCKKAIVTVKKGQSIDIMPR